MAASSLIHLLWVIPLMLACGGLAFLIGWNLG
jgi:hypothetical protein